MCSSLLEWEQCLSSQEYSIVFSLALDRVLLINSIWSSEKSFVKCVGTVAPLWKLFNTLQAWTESFKTPKLLRCLLSLYRKETWLCVYLGWYAILSSVHTEVQTVGCVLQPLWAAGSSDTASVRPQGWDWQLLSRDCGLRAPWWPDTIPRAGSVGGSRSRDWFHQAPWQPSGTTQPALSPVEGQHFQGACEPFPWCLLSALPSKVLSHLNTLGLKKLGHSSV